MGGAQGAPGGVRGSSRRHRAAPGAAAWPENPGLCAGRNSRMHLQPHHALMPLSSPSMLETLKVWPKGLETPEKTVACPKAALGISGKKEKFSQVALELTNPVGEQRRAGRGWRAGVSSKPKALPCRVYVRLAQRSAGRRQVTRAINCLLNQPSATELIYDFFFF